MNVEALGLWLVVISGIVAFVAWGMKRYKSVLADGVTLEEVIDAVEEAAEKVEEIKEDIDAAVEASE